MTATRCGCGIPETGEQRGTLTGHENYVESVEFSPDGRTLASVDGDGALWLWDTETGEKKGTLTKLVGTFEFSPDGTTLVSGDALTGRVMLWDTETGEHKRSLAGHTDYVYYVLLSPG